MKFFTRWFLSTNHKDIGTTNFTTNQTFGLLKKGFFFSTKKTIDYALLLKKVQRCRIEKTIRDWEIYTRSCEGAPMEEIKKNLEIIWVYHLLFCILELEVLSSPDKPKKGHLKNPLPRWQIVEAMTDMMEKDACKFDYTQELVDIVDPADPPHEFQRKIAVYYYLLLSEKVNGMITACEMLHITNYHFLMAFLGQGT